MNCSGTLAPSVEFTTETLYIVVCYSIVFFFAFVGNAVMFLILFRNQCQKRRRVHSLLLHMTVAHLLVTMIYMPKEIIHNITVGWWGGDLLCRICKFFDVFGVALSAGILMCLSLDRFYSILFPLYVINAKRSVTRMLTVAWCVSILTSLPQIYIFRAAQHPCFDWYRQCVSADVIGLISPKVTFWFSVLNILQVYFLPLIVILICYGSILISISLKTRSASFARAADTVNVATTTAQKRSSVEAAAVSTALSTSAFLFQNQVKSSPSIGLSSKLNLASERSNDNGKEAQTTPALCCPKGFIPKSNSISASGITTSNYAMAGTAGGSSVTTASCANGIISDAVLRRTGGENSFQRAKNRTLKMTVVLVFAFLLCWTPYTVAMFIHFMYASQRIIPPLLRKFLYAFAVFNSAISPYLYGYFSFDIWEELRLLLLYLCSTPNCLAHCGCKKLGKTSMESMANRRHAIRVRTTGELSSSTLLPPTTTVSGSSIRHKQSHHYYQHHHYSQQQQQQQPYQLYQVDESTTFRGNCCVGANAVSDAHAKLAARGSSCSGATNSSDSERFVGLQSALRFSFRTSKTLSLDSTTVNLCYRATEALSSRLSANINEATLTVSTMEPTKTDFELDEDVAEKQALMTSCAKKTLKCGKPIGTQLVIANGVALCNGNAKIDTNRPLIYNSYTNYNVYNTQNSAEDGVAHRESCATKCDESMQPLLSRSDSATNGDSSTNTKLEERGAKLKQYDAMLISQK